MRTITLEPILDRSPVLIVGGDGAVLDSNIAWTQFVASRRGAGARADLYDLLAFVGSAASPTAGPRELRIHQVALRNALVDQAHPMPYSSALLVPIVHRRRDTYLVVLLSGRHFHPDALRFAELLATDASVVPEAAARAGDRAVATQEDLALPIEVEGVLRNAADLVAAATDLTGTALAELPDESLIRLRAGVPGRRLVLGLDCPGAPECPEGVFVLPPGETDRRDVRRRRWPPRQLVSAAGATNPPGIDVCDRTVAELPSWLQREFADAPLAGGPARFVVATMAGEVGAATLAAGPWSGSEVIPPDERALVEIAVRVLALRLEAARRERLLGEQVRRLTAALEAERVALGRTSEKLAPVAISQTMAAAMDRGKALVALDRPFAVWGETGAGRRSLVRYLVAVGPGREGPVVEISCRFHDERWLREDLFGACGSDDAAGSTRGGPGKLWLAAGGTLILGDADHIPAALQAELTAALRDWPAAVGAPRPRIVATFEAEPEVQAQRGVLHPDLAALFGARVVAVPPLAQRREDIVPLASRFLGAAAQDLGRPPPALSACAVDRLMALPWKGHVRELKGAMEAAVAMADRGVVEADHLPGAGGASEAGPARGPASAPSIDLSVPFSMLKQRWIDHFESAYLDAAIRRSGGNLSAAARLAGMDKKNFHAKAARFGLAGSGGVRHGRRG